MTRPPPDSTLTDSLFPYTTPFRSDDLAAGVDVFAARAQVFADRDDPVAVDRDVGDKGRAARTIDDGAAANHQIIHVRSPKLFRSEEHTSELKSQMRISYAVFCLKKKQNKHTRHATQREHFTT